jgi:branched-chain amino acid transport system ATP-binding protein
VLEVRDLTIRFGGLTAIDGLNLKVDEWEIVGLMGPNGAGKTTAFNCITGFYKPSRGEVFYRDREVTKLPPHRKAALGIGRTFQNVGMVKSETALQNLLTAQHTSTGYGALKGLTGAGTVRQREKELVATSGTSGSARCPMARSSFSSSAVHWRRTRTCCCSTSRPAAWVRRNRTS